jgi:hypothetical protein
MAGARLFERFHCARGKQGEIPLSLRNLLLAICKAFLPRGRYVLLLRHCLMVWMSDSREPYPSDVSDDEWSLVVPYLTLNPWRPDR